MFDLIRKRRMAVQQQIFALITAQEHCSRIISVAKEFAEHLSAELVVLTVQPIHADAKRRSNDMICLTTLAKTTKCNIRMIYSDKPVSALCKELERCNPTHIFTGQGSAKSDFLSRLHMELVGAPISIVGTDGVICTLPAVIEEIAMLG